MILSGLAGASAGFLMTSVISADLLRRLFGIMLVSGGIVSLRKLSKRKYDEMLVVVKVKNSENTLEATVRMILWKCLCASHIVLRSSGSKSVCLTCLGSNPISPTY